jgi:YD repeat-containing protein
MFRKLSLLILFVFYCRTSYSQDVNPFTGGFSYGQNIMHIPSNRGSGVEINLSYGSGIQMDQSSSEVGLGWNINAGGAVYRSVSGIPDDVKNFYTTNFRTGIQSNGAGCLYPSDGDTKQDIYLTNRGLDTSHFAMPDFDAFNVSGPGFGGLMKLNYFRFYSYEYQQINATPEEYAYKYDNGFVKKPQFHFVGDFADTLVSRHYSTTINSSTPFRTYTTQVSGNGYTSSNLPFIGKHLNGSTILNENFDTLTDRLATSNFVEYFTNEEINNANTNNFSSGPLASFIDFQSNHARSSSVFPADGIGYFRITASNGLTYHYSLPVYRKETTTYKIPLENDYDVVSGIGTGDFNSNEINFYNGNHPSTNKIVIKEKLTNKYAEKWLLTAVTGADYVDSNNNHIVDDADAGYWIKYDYVKWSNSFVSRYPYYGFEYEYSPDRYSDGFPEYFPLNPSNSSNPFKLSGLFGNSTIVKNEVYYLSKIRTSSHTALFIRDIRLDQKGMSDAVTVPTNYLPAPSLLLNRVVLFKNDHLDSLLTAITPTGPAQATFNTLDYPQFDFSTVDPSAPFFTEKWFNLNFPFSKPGSSPSYNYNLNHCILKNVYFDQDYSLCRGYHGNINVNYNGSSVLTNPNQVETNISIGTYSVSGKLTLNKIFVYDYGNVKVTPSVIFNYDASNSLSGCLSNPDYNPKKQDYWGYYKSDATNNAYSRYTTSSSKNCVKAWSLLSILDHLGGSTEIEYESNTYNRVLDHESPSGLRGAAFIYRIKSIPDGTDPENFNILMEEGNTSANLLSEFGTLCSNSINGIKKRICIPISLNVAANNVAITDQNYLNGFAFGEPSTNITYTPSGYSNNITGSITSVITGSPNSGRWAINYPNNNLLYEHSDPGGLLYSTYQPSSYDGSYAGNGYLFFETPIGYEVFGGGIRVKKLKSRSAVSEVYEKEYSYQDGVATQEADRFEYPRMKRRNHGSVIRLTPLEPKSMTSLDLSPMIGYSKVTIKDLGRVNASNGKIEVSYLTNPAYSNSVFISSNAISSATSQVINSVTETRVIQEAVSVWSNAFGAELETCVFDINDNLLSKSVNVYTTTEQGSIVENIHYFDVAAVSHTVNILREIPIVLLRTINYSMGGKQTTQTISRDELTGESIAIKADALNKSTSISYKVPAYKYYQTAENLDFKSPELRKVIPLGHDFFTYSNIDSTLTLTQSNGFSKSFLSAGYKLYSKLAKMRVLNGAVLTNTTTNLSYYYNNRTFVFDGGFSSLDSFGLFKKEALYTNTLNLSNYNSQVYFETSSPYNWRLVNEVTLLDRFKNVLEQRDVNNRFSAYKYSNNGYYKSASVDNCNYESFSFADFENPPITNTTVASIDGELLVNNHTFVNYSTLMPHTGSKSIRVNTTPVTYTAISVKSPSNTLNVGIIPGRIYRTSVWTHTTNATNAEIKITLTGSVNSVYGTTITTANTSGNLITTIGSWSLIQTDFELPESFDTGINGVVKIELKSSNSSDVHFDDFVLHPVESNFSANVYNPRNGRIMSSIDANGLATNYKYDAAGRLLELWKEIPGVGLKKIKAYTYNYARGINN